MSEDNLNFEEILKSLNRDDFSLHIKSENVQFKENCQADLENTFKNLENLKKYIINDPKAYQDTINSLLKLHKTI
jgi:hypothetical protein